ncbi:YslB family protein [Bacillus testis]|uniref:YslB family protein n=1 Tax=Bacillus testis TaxID=1622072 RepID=UPI00067E9946|nr:YslB family protein [Bacillus testis]
MAKEQAEQAAEEQQQSETATISLFSKELLRDILLPDLLGKDHSQVLYWSGKQLARKFPLQSLEEVAAFFDNAGWGTLEKEKESKNQAEFVLSGEIVTRRFAITDEPEFQLEAGFLAQQLQQQKSRITEAAVETKKRGAKANFLVRWDTKDIIRDEV